MRLGERADWKHKIRCYCHDDADSRGWSIHRWSRLATSSVTIDGSKFKAVTNRDKNFTRVNDGAAAHPVGGERRTRSEPT